MAASVAQPSHMAPLSLLHLHRPSPLRQAQAPSSSGASSETTPEASTAEDSRHDRLLGLHDFVRIRTLGTGTFARVCLVSLRDPESESERKKVFALKILRKSHIIKLNQIDHVRNERAVLQDVSGHPFITNLLASFSDHANLYLLLDYVPGGELFSYLRKMRRFQEPVARFYAAEIVLILEYLHEDQHGIAYRDLKPENLLLDEDGHIKLVDFGFAKRLGGGPDREREEASTYTLCGTPEYLAPEVIQNRGHTTAVDWWALGILIYEFLTGYPPFWSQNHMEIYKQIVERPIRFPIGQPEISAEAQHLIKGLCTVDRTYRLGNMSNGAKDIKNHPWFAGVNWDDVARRRHKGPIIPPIRHMGDASCFEMYAEEDENVEEYTQDMADQYDAYFAEF